MATTESEAVKVESGKLMCCLTCPLCNNLFIDATTISECLHTFCRDCIYEKINEDELESCPVCNAYLGGVPLEKLRADHIMDDLREKIFPCKRRKENAPEITVSSLSSHSATKTISISTAQENLAAQQWSTATVAHREVPSVQNKQNNTQVMEKETDDSNKKEAIVTSSNDCSLNDTLVKAEPIQIDDAYCNVQEHGHMPIIERVEKSGQMFGTSGSVQHGKLQDVSRRGSRSANGSYEHARRDVDADRRSDKLTNPIWFALVASDHQEGNEPLPQISSNYLRVRDGNITVSLIQKYLVKKLGLTSEIEVEISLKGQPVRSTLHLHDIVELWRHTTTKAERIQVSVGSSAKDFVMVLSYGRKSCQPGNFPNVCAHLKNNVHQEIK